jgi:hypothetical protein
MIDSECFQPGSDGKIFASAELNEAEPNVNKIEDQKEYDQPDALI